MLDARDILGDEDLAVWHRLERATRLVWLGYMFGGSEWADDLKVECNRLLGILMAEGRPRTTIATLDEKSALRVCGELRELINRVEGV